MSVLRISTDDDRKWFKPGSTVSGAVEWTTDDAVEAIELRLFWHTRGKGTEEVEVVDRLRMARPEPNGVRRFSFRLPEAPYSFSGRLITLRWALEVVVEPSKEAEGLEIVVGPRPVEVDIAHMREQ